MGVNLGALDSQTVRAEIGRLGLVALRKVGAPTLSLVPSACEPSVQPVTVE